jgi:uncharacterized membrane protein
MTPLSKRLIIALVISVAVNLLIGGVFVGSALHRRQMRAERGQFTLPPRGPGGPGARFGGPREEPAWGAPQGREERGAREHRRGGPFGGTLAGHKEEMQARRKAVMGARAAVHDALVKDPFDPAALDQSLIALRKETATTQELLHQAIVDAAKTGDAETRTKLARGFDRLDNAAGGP